MWKCSIKIVPLILIVSFSQSCPSLWIYICTMYWKIHSYVILTLVLVWYLKLSLIKCRSIPKGLNVSSWIVGGLSCISWMVGMFAIDLETSHLFWQWKNFINSRFNSSHLFEFYCRLLVTVGHRVKPIGIYVQNPTPSFLLFKNQTLISYYTLIFF